jgi:hypothetical protein
MPKLIDPTVIAQHYRKSYHEVEWCDIHCAPPGLSCPLHDREITSFVPDHPARFMPNSRKAYPT